MCFLPSRRFSGEQNLFACFTHMLIELLIFKTHKRDTSIAITTRSDFDRRLRTAHTDCAFSSATAHFFCERKQQRAAHRVGWQRASAAVHSSNTTHPQKKTQHKNIYTTQLTQSTHCEQTKNNKKRRLQSDRKPLRLIPIKDVSQSESPSAAPSRAVPRNV